MANRWYYAHDDVKKGPFSAEQLRALADSGDILLTDTIWKNDMERGVLARKVDLLFSPGLALVPPESVLPPVSVVVSLPRADVPLASELFPEKVPDLLPLNPVAKAPAPVGHASQQQHIVKRNARAVRGATIVSQDGEYVRFRKKCTTCAHENSSWDTMRIVTGMMKSGFFCPKCRKNREVAIQGSQS